MAEKAAGRRHQDDLAAAALLEHLPAGRARHQPGLRDVGVDDFEKIRRRLIDDLAHLVDARGDDEDVEPAEALRPPLSRSPRSWLPSSGASSTASTLPPSFLHSPRPSPVRRRCRRRSRHWRRPPQALSAASAPNAPDAPVTIAVLPLTSNSESGFLRKSSDIDAPLRHARPCAGHPAFRASQGWMAGPARHAAAASLRRRRDGDRIEHISLPRLTISRFSFGPMKQESFSFSTVSLPPTITVNSPASTK